MDITNFNKIDNWYNKNYKNAVCTGMVSRSKKMNWMVRGMYFDNIPVSMMRTFDSMLEDLTFIQSDNFYAEIKIHKDTAFIFENSNFFRFTWTTLDKFILSFNNLSISGTIDEGVEPRYFCVVVYSSHNRELQYPLIYFQIR